MSTHIIFYWYCSIIPICFVFYRLWWCEWSARSIQPRGSGQWWTKTASNAAHDVWRVTRWEWLLNAQFAKSTNHSWNHRLIRKTWLEKNLLTWDDDHDFRSVIQPKILKKKLLWSNPQNLVWPPVLYLLYAKGASINDMCSLWMAPKNYYYYVCNWAQQNSFWENIDDD